MRIPHQILKCVGFISHDQSRPDYLGTVFIVGVRSEDDPTNTALHLVTARHVAELIDPGPFVIAMNAKDGAKLLLKSGDAQWWYHPTEKASVDVAVTPFCPQMFDDYDIEWIPDTVFASDKSIQEYGVGLGDEVFTAGLFTEFWGTTRFEPLVRTGNIAMMPTGKIPIKGFGNVEAYLVEGRSIGGLSGSPVFVRHTVHMSVEGKKGEQTQMSGISSRIQLLGLMHGHWDLPLTFTKTEQAEAVNMGVAIVVPAKKILETLYHPELVQMRKTLEQKDTDRRSPVADSARKAPHFTRMDFEDALKKASRKIESEAKK
jgi:hypothetical protein